MANLLVGFDSAWTPTNSGALVGGLLLADGTFRELGPLQTVDYHEAAAIILRWQHAECPVATMVLLDQPTIVKNATGQRPVENLVSSLVSLRYGGMQPANTGRTEMFGRDAPIWGFLNQFGGPADPLKSVADTLVLETYPVLAMMAFGWILPDRRPTGRLPKYNPDNRKTFSILDWRHVCGKASGEFRRRDIVGIANWIDDAAKIPRPRKSEQDKLDACLCLLVALCLVEQMDCLMVGDLDTGYIVAPHAETLRAELDVRCEETKRRPAEWVRVFRFGTAPTTPVTRSLAC
jgi:predicted RNase H-like nuclease